MSAISHIFYTGESLICSLYATNNLDKSDYYSETLSFPSTMHPTGFNTSHKWHLAPSFGDFHCHPLVLRTVSLLGTCLGILLKFFLRMCFLNTVFSSICNLVLLVFRNFISCGTLCFFPVPWCYRSLYQADRGEEEQGDMCVLKVLKNS